MHLKIGEITVNLDAIVATDTINREHPVTRKVARALRLNLVESHGDPILLFDEEADAFRAFVASKSDMFVDILKANATKGSAKAEATDPAPKAPDTPKPTPSAPSAK